MQKKRVLITGGTSGLGYELVKCFMREGYEVYSTGRDNRKFTEPEEYLHFVKVDFSDLDDVVKKITEILISGVRFDIIINNAGVLSPPLFSQTVNGFEYSFQVNFLTHLLINTLVIRAKNDSGTLSIVTVTSPVYRYVKPDYKMPHRDGYRSFKSYSESKFYLLCIGDHLLRSYPEKNIKFISFDPGTFSSEIHRTQKRWFRKMYWVAAPFMRSPESVASRLMEILRESNLVMGAVYKRKNSFRLHYPKDSVVVEKFMEVCSSELGEYLT